MVEVWLATLKLKAARHIWAAVTSGRMELAMYGQE
jgi:hypothetical protein